MSDVEAALVLLEDGWPQRFTPEQATVYLEALDDLDGAAVRRAVGRLIRTDEFRPSVARIRREVLAGERPTLHEAMRQAEAIMRWREALQYVNGSGFEPQKPDVHAAVLEALAGVRSGWGWRDRFVVAWKAL